MKIRPRNGHTMTNGSGAYEALGGVWDGAAHTFTVAASETASSGDLVATGTPQQENKIA